jgi:hypothetical protein
VVASSGRALVKLFVLAVILESALALLFNWRPFVVVFDGRGVKSIVSLAAALAVTFGFKPDAVATLLTAYGSTVAADNAWLARILEAMVIAGGSAAVNSLLVNLGFRSIVRAEEVQPKPAADEAWLSVALTRVEAVGPVQVEIAEGSDPAKASWRLAGTITGTGRRRRGAAFFLRDFSRFPNSGGRTLQPGQPYMVRLTGKSQNADPLESKPPWGPCTLASRAMIDIELKL